MKIISPNSKFILFCILSLLSGCKNDEVIVQPELKVIKLIFPTGGEHFTVNDTIPIIWECSTSELLKIEFSSDLGSEWIEIVDSLLSEKKVYLWITPNIISSNCLIKVSIFSSTDSLSLTFSVDVPDYKRKYLSYYPLGIGNQWIYKCTRHLNQDTLLYLTIVGDTLINHKMYFKIENEIYNDIYYTYEMVDTLTGNIFRYEFNQERVIDNLYAEVGDKIDCRRYGSDDSTLFESEEILYLWQTFGNMRTYFNDGFPSRARYSLVNGIGLFASHRSIVNAGINTDTLKACRIYGTVYGDTTLFK